MTDKAATARGEVSLDDRLAFERLLANLSARFANVSGARLEDEIEEALRLLIDFLGFDRSTFAEIGADGTASILCSAAVAGVDPFPRGPAPKFLNWLARELQSGRLIVVRDPSDLPPAAAGEADYVRRSGLQSQITIPLLVGERVVAAIAFGAFHSTRAWPEDLIARIKIVGEVFAQAIARRRSRRELAAALAEIKPVKGPPRGGKQISPRNRRRQPAERADQRDRRSLQVDSGRDRPGRADRRDGAAARRDRQRQGGAGAGDPRRERPAGPADGQGQLRGAAGDADRERAVRPREGRLHRRARAPDRPLRDRRRRHALPRRDRRAAARTAGEAAAGPAGAASSSGSAGRETIKVDVRVIAATNRDLDARGRATASSARTSTTA